MLVIEWRFRRHFVLQLFYSRLSAVETPIERLHETYISTSLTVSISIPSDVDSCLFRAITSTKDDQFMCALCIECFTPH